MEDKNIVKPETFLTLAKKLLAVQTALKAPKSQYNNFGKYSYRNAEDIVEAVKPLAATHNILLTVSDDVVNVGGRIYVKSTAKVTNVENPSETIECTAFAREAETKKGMDESQITGAASSYARKYALNGLFAIDDTKDADSNENKGTSTTKTSNEAAVKCRKCGKEIPSKTGKDGVLRSPAEVAEACNGLCINCFKVENAKGKEG